MADWKIQKLNQCCSLHNRAFEVGDTIWSALFEQGGKLYRADFCDDAWQRRQAGCEAGEEPEAVVIEVRQADREEPQQVCLEGRPLYYWKQIKLAPEERPRRRFVDDSVLYDFFQQLGSDDHPKRRALRYVLGLHLIRRKRLKFQDIARDADNEYLILSEPKDATVVYRVLDPHLSEEQVLELRGQMDRLLNMDFDDEEQTDAEAQPGKDKPAPSAQPAASD